MDPRKPQEQEIAFCRVSEGCLPQAKCAETSTDGGKMQDEAVKNADKRNFSGEIPLKLKVCLDIISFHGIE